MNFRIFIIAAVYTGLNFIPPLALADTVYLKNGKTLAVEKSWQESHRKRDWFTVEQAAEKLQQAELIAMVKTLAEILKAS